KPPLLVSAAKEWDQDEGEEGEYVGTVWLWDVDRGTYLGRLMNVPDTAVWESPTDWPRPALTAWHTGPALKQVRVAIAWDDRFFRVWDVDRDEKRARE